MRTIRKQRDARFIIYQCLYIFAISVLIYKGTDLSLDEVTSNKKNFVELKPNQSVVDTSTSAVIMKDVSKDTIVQISTVKDTVVKKEDVGIKIVIKQVVNNSKDRTSESNEDNKKEESENGDKSESGKTGTRPKNKE